MNRRACIVCETNAHTNYYCTVDEAEYVRCGQCGLMYVDKPEHHEDLYKAYTGGFWKELRRKIMAPVRRFPQVSHFEDSMERARQIFEFSSSFVGEKSGEQLEGQTDTGVYLDIGCNKGFLLATAVDLGWNVYGEELVPELTAPFCKTYKQFRDQIYNGRFQDVRHHFSENTFDLITAIDVIEHFEDPVTDIASVLEILKPGGVFVIQTPDAGCDQAKDLVEKWGALKPLEHLHLFDEGNLGTFVSRAGFVDYQVREPFEDADGNFVAVMKKPV